ncbi:MULTISPECIES: hypothetical protein [Xenorhabdus]|uniref:hypothetical protein n=1 Tax=Xenorhabdus TaxID=626 RepID=UPI000649C24C|nr:MULTISPECIES: hypothetical protein [Xenorhabdus]KLU15560.1 hypothetical protein AAY47_10315 [Xenorhabdus griffiniae]KOP34185.1 hypothetical protein AFK69_06095 [Xenorhabdus sp. GDc328]
MKIKSIVIGIILATGFFSVSANANPANTLYKKAIGNIVDNAQCSEQEFMLEIPRKISDDEDDIELYNTQFTNDVFVTLSKDINTKGKFNVGINISPAPNTLAEQLTAFCVVSAFQAAIDPRQTTNEYMKLSAKMYSLALKSKSGHYYHQSKNYEHSAYIDVESDKPTLTFQFYPQGYELPR